MRRRGADARRRTSQLKKQEVRYRHTASYGGAAHDAQGAETILPLSHNSPFHEHVYSAWSGDESNATQVAGCKRIAAMMADVSANGITIEAASSATGTLTFRVSFVLGGG